MNVTVDFTYHCQPLEVGMKEYTVCIAMEKIDHSYLFKHDGIGGFFFLLLIILLTYVTFKLYTCITVMVVI